MINNHDRLHKYNSDVFDEGDMIYLFDFYGEIFYLVLSRLPKYLLFNILIVFLINLIIQAGSICVIMIC